MYAASKHKNDDKMVLLLVSELPVSEANTVFCEEN